MNSRRNGARAGAAVILITVGATLAAGCLDRDLKPLQPCVVSGVVRNVKVTNVDEVDLLFMVDNSNSMAEEQASLNEQFPRLISVLATGDTNADGTPEFPPVRSLHVGVVSSDMGTGGNTVPTCSEPMFGDDGVLNNTGNTALAGCMATYSPAFLTFEPATGADPAAFARDFQCVAQLGTGGCGFEQQLEAVLKAVTPSTSPVTFFGGTVGHGDGRNAGFLRATSLLAIVMVTDEEDCSAADPELFNPTSSVYPGDLNLRCFMYPGAVYPVERYVDGLVALRPISPELLVYAAITGVPTDLVANPSIIDYDAILADSRMQEEIDPAMPTRLKTSCNVPGRGVAYPPRRIVQVANLLQDRGAGTVIQSICQSDFSPALNAIIAKIADVLGGACLPRALNRAPDGSVKCDVVEILPLEGEATRCEQLAGAGREPTPIRIEDGHEVCRITQLVASGGSVPPGEGWYYDDFSADVLSKCSMTPQRISFTGGATPRTGSEIRLECLQPVSGGQAGEIVLGSACADNPSICGSSALVRGMACDNAGAEATNTCQLGCNSDADCHAQNLGAFVCDFVRGVGGAAGFCVNPTCGQ